MDCQSWDRTVGLLLVTVTLTAGGQAKSADAVADFYRGKTVTLIVGSGVGGGTDIGGRLISRYLGKVLPGNPTVIVRNMAGVSGLRAAEYAYNVAPRDGTTLTFTLPYMVTQKIVNSAVKIDPKQLTWIGRQTTLTTYGVVWHTSPVQTVEQAKHQEMFMAANGVTGTAAMVPWALNRAAGTKFKVTAGYESSNVAALAMERGEAGGIGSVSTEFLESKPDWFEKNLVGYLYTIGYERTKRAPNAPTIVELATNEMDRKAMQLLSSSSAIGWVLVGPPDIPQDRADALRQAFTRMVELPEFIAEANKLKVAIDPLAGDKLSTLVNDLFALPPEVVNRMNELIEPPK